MNQQAETSPTATRRAVLFEGLFCLLDSPSDVLNHPRMSLDEKRALLSSWASDSHAVENQPTLRKLDNGRIIPVEEILHCLKELDRGSGQSHLAMPWLATFDRRRSLVSEWRRKWRFTGKDDDDDPPPCPAPVAPREPGGGQSGARMVADHEPAYA